MIRSAATVEEAIRDPEKSTSRRLWIFLILIPLLLGGIYGYQERESHAKGIATSATPAPTQSVSAIAVQYQPLSTALASVGTLRAVMGVEISAQVAGTVTAIHFESGAEARKGQLLVELLANEDVAKLQALRATADLSKLTYDRANTQLQFQAVSQHTVDTTRETWKRDEALVDQQRAFVDLKSIRAPFGGQLGIRRVDVGQYVEAGTPMVRLQTLDAVYLDFSLPQQAIGNVRSGRGVLARVDAYPDRTFRGTITAISGSVDPDTRNLQVRATLINADHALLPGMFATVEIDTQQRHSSLVVPQTAINYHSYGNSVFVVDEPKDGAGQVEPRAREVAVTTGEAHGDLIVILDGLVEGQTVVTAGQSKLANGTAVKINNSIMPSADPRPEPIDQ